MRIAALIILVMLAFIPSLGAKSGDGGRTYGDMDGVIFLNNYDGDTMRFTLPGIHPLIGENIPVRLRGVDTPEIRAKCPAEKQRAVEARERVQRILLAAQRITLKEMGRDKYFRIVASVVADGVDVGEVLIRTGLAVPYEGGRKESGWCGEK